MWTWFHRFGSPRYFYEFSGKWAPWFGWSSLVCILIGLYLGLFVAPPDYQQGQSYRIIFIHVPSAWMSLFVYMNMAAAALVALVWKIKVADVVVTSCAPIGASFTFLALVTGSLWGKPTWGTWWVWDARLTSELVLLFLYLGVIALRAAIEDRTDGSRAAGILALVGVVNIPIIHYSVEWWNTLHQGATVSKLDAPSIHISMLLPLLLMAVAFMLYFSMTLLLRARCEILDRERRSRWALEVVNGT